MFDQSRTFSPSHETSDQHSINSDVTEDRFSTESFPTINSNLNNDIAGFRTSSTLDSSGSYFSAFQTIRTSHIHDDSESSRFTSSFSFKKRLSRLWRQPNINPRASLLRLFENTGSRYSSSDYADQRVRLLSPPVKPSMGIRSVSSLRLPSVRSRAGSLNSTAIALDDDSESLRVSKVPVDRDDRIWYDQFTSTDWVHDSIADSIRVRALRSRKDIRGKFLAWFDGAHGWILVAIIGCLTAFVAYFVNVSEPLLFDMKHGYCSTSFMISSIKSCCQDKIECDDWQPWSSIFRGTSSFIPPSVTNFLIYVLCVVILASLSCLLTLTSKTNLSFVRPLDSIPDALESTNSSHQCEGGSYQRFRQQMTVPMTILSRHPLKYYSAAGSGVAEVKVILSGFVLHGSLGLRTLVVKTLALVLSVSSGLSVGKEGPYVHIATCIGNIACRIFPKYNSNDAKRREVLSASAASGVAVAFGAPIGGVLFSLEEVSYYFPPKTLFRTFFCCIVSALVMKFLNPYGTGKIVPFEVRYIADWHFIEMIAFIFLGVLGGALGAGFIKFSRFWIKTLRSRSLIRRFPLLEVVAVATITGLCSYWLRFTTLPVSDLLLELASPCDVFSNSGVTLCPTVDHIWTVVRYLGFVFIVKAFLTMITFGILLPAGIYIPSMVVGGILGRIVGHTVQYIAMTTSSSRFFGNCSIDSNPESCVVPGVYAMVAAGATMCGVTRLSVTLAVILFELTGSLNHVLPFSLSILVSKWTADALEPLSVYDLLTQLNSYPYLDNKSRPVFETDLESILPRGISPQRVIDVSDSPSVSLYSLRVKLDLLHASGELDGGLPIIRNGVLVGLIPAPDLEFALDKLYGRLGPDKFKSACTTLFARDYNTCGSSGTSYSDTINANSNIEVEAYPSVVTPIVEDISPIVDCAPISLDINSPLELVHECFVKLGLRYLCILRNGKFAGMIHKKAFVQFIHRLERKHK